MPEYIDPPEHLEPRRSRRRILILAVFVFGIFVVGRTILSDWVDLLWFQSLGFGGVFWKTVGLEVAAFTIFTEEKVFGDWSKVQKDFFGDGGVFDQIYKAPGQ